MNSVLHILENATFGRTCPQKTLSLVCPHMGWHTPRKQLYYIIIPSTYIWCKYVEVQTVLAEPIPEWMADQENKAPLRTHRAQPCRIQDPSVSLGFNRRLHHDREKKMFYKHAKPSYAEATFIKSTMIQRFLKTI